VPLSPQMSGVDSSVLDCLQKSTDIIIQGRRSITSPVTDGTITDAFADNAHYCAYALQPWRRSLTRPLVVDLFLADPPVRGGTNPEGRTLIERWTLVYQRKDESKDVPLGTINKKIATLMRTLYCFVRLLPGFQLLLATPKPESIYFHIYNPETLRSTPNFVQETSLYDFPRLNTSKGVLSISVRYVKETFLQVSELGRLDPLHSFLLF
jgi:Autophagy-related protein 13